MAQHSPLGNWARNVSRFSSRYKLGARLKVLAVLAVIVLFVHPLRNNLVPGWPRVWNDLSTFKVARINVMDLFFYIDRSPYTGSCQDIREKLSKINMPKLENMPVYKYADYETRVREKWSDSRGVPHPGLGADLKTFTSSFRPSLTTREQQFLLFTLISITQALNAFNISYFLSEGTLIGSWRHHGSIPWDDDADLMLDSSKWELAKAVLSCLPGLEVNLGADFMWKVYHKEAPLWKGEDQVRYPFVDVFPYRYDSHHVWPLCIWFKQMTVADSDWIFPLARAVFEGWPVRIPARTDKFLYHLYGYVSSSCDSRTFRHRERESIPKTERIRLPCSRLHDIYPFVRRTKVDIRTNTVLEERVLSSNQVLSTLNTTFHGTLEDDKLH